MLPAALAKISEPASTPEPEEGVALLFTAGAGARLGSSRAYTSPSLLARVGASLGRWEAHTYAQWDVDYAALGGDEPEPSRLSALDFGIAAGRREPFGFAALVYGVQLGVYRVSWDAPAPPAQGAGAAEPSVIILGTPQGTRTEPRLGLYAGLALPRATAIRLRPGAAFDLSPTYMGKTHDELGGPVLWWSVALTLSVEMRSF
jgi:hypothetical protein